MITINLNNQVVCQNLCNKIQKLVSDYHHNNPNHKDILLVIDIKEVNRTVYPDLPKLEYKK